MHCSMMQADGGYNLLVLPQFKRGEAWSIPSDRPTVLELGEDVGFYIEQLSREWDSETGSEISEHLAAMILHRVFGSLLGEEALAKTAQPTPASAIGMIESYVNGNYYKRITLADLSPVVHLCEKQVARIIKREYGMTLTQLLAQKRVGAAQMLLKSTDLKISEIAQRVSPTAENYFFASFREIVGMSPLQYRKAYRK